jgi:hypothetical protein
VEAEFLIKCNLFAFLPWNLHRMLIAGGGRDLNLLACWYDVLMTFHVGNNA